MSNAISVQSLSKRFGDHQALDRVSFEVPKGAVVGLIGPNGAGKTTALKAILGLSAFEGTVEVLGKSPRSAPHQMMTSVGYISDVGILPRWLKVNDALKFTQAIHPQFDLEKAHAILAKTDIPLKQRVKALSKGMVTQLHLALVLAMDVQLLI
ncbi:ATP-binding cassette domain-containing protein, partial [Pseudomonadales bacterium]|nr:ATP-binding cassette domain-containing protein [Pseudomonadales bacterium]